MDKNQERLDKLLIALLDGKLSATEKEELQEILKASEEARAYYLNYCQMHALLNEEYGQIGLEASHKTITASPRHRLWPLWFATAAAVILLTFASLWKKAQTKNRDLPVAGQAAVAVLANSIAAEFDFKGVGRKKMAVGQPLLPGLYDLTKGIIQIDYENGAQVVLEAPCTFELLNENSLGCRQGKLSAFVPPTARYFTVQSSGVSVVDLGTEFSIHVVKDKFLEAHVFKGAVEVQMHYETNDRQYRLDAGQAVRLLMGRYGPVVAGVDLKENFFIRRLSEPATAYSRKINELHPVAYFPMEINSDGKTLKDFSQYRNNGYAVDVKDLSSLWVAGRIGSAIQLSGSNNKAYVYVPDYPKTSNDQLSVVGWVYAESRPIWATIIKNWGNDTFGQFHFGLNESGRLDIEIASRNGKRRHITEKRKLPLQQWQHVAFVNDGKTVKVFRNGVEVARGKTDGILYPVKLKKIGIGTKLDDKEKGPAPGTPGHWDGRLDELAVFNQALTDEQIAELYHLSK